MEKKQSINFWGELITYWQFWVAILTAVVYIIGYINGKILLRSLDSQITPTEIYSVGSLFVWGLTFFITSLIAPTVLAIFPLLLNYFGFFRNRMRIYIFAAIALVLVFFLLPFMAKVNPIGFEFLPRADYLRTDIFFRFYTAVSLCLAVIPFFILRTMKLDFQLILITILAIFSWNCALFVGSELNSMDISVGAPPGLFYQSPAIPGALITRGRISARGNEAPAFGVEAFQTDGLLLNRRDGAYYFSPGIFAQDAIAINLPESSIVIVPESKVLVFISLDTCFDCP